jgi:hypothetical protein
MVWCYFPGLDYMLAKELGREEERGYRRRTLLDDDLRREDRAIIVADATSERLLHSRGQSLCNSLRSEYIQDVSALLFGLLIAERTSRSSK